MILLLQRYNISSHRQEEVAIIYCFASIVSYGKKIYHAICVFGFIGAISA